MKSLRAYAALAVATAITHGRYADAKNATTLTPLDPDGNKHCTTEINAWRKTLDSTLKDYVPSTDPNPETTLSSFFTANDCDALKSGKFTHINGESESQIFVVSVTPAQLSGSTISCQDAVNEWKKGFEAFSGQYPAQYQDNSGVYATPNAVGLVSLLSQDAQTIYCGTPNVCDPGTLVCYYKPSVLTANKYPVTPELWHKVQESFTLKPKIVAHAEDHGDCVEAVNAVRTVAGLELPEFTAAGQEAKMRAARSTPPAYENALYNLTCKQIDEGTVDPTAADGFTIIYATKAGNDPPTAADAVAHWKSGFTQLGTTLPPAFTATGHRDGKKVDGTIYYDSAVGGFASIMADDSRQMRCYDATGCTNSALICFLSAPTLVNTQAPISDTTWKKILALYEADAKQITLRPRDEQSNCLTEVNEFRTHKNIGLSPFLVDSSTSSEDPNTPLSGVPKTFTCGALRDGRLPIMFTGQNLSLMYFSGVGAMCYEAVNAWKKGYKQFNGVTTLPAYNSDEALYQSAAATNFVSLVSEGENTTMTCYTAEGCAEEGLVCVLKPAVFKDGSVPISQDTWTRVYTAVSNGAGAVSVYGALLSSVLVAVGLSVLNF
ncbi:SAG family member [Eimeria praecox]|uniref:SAG family member n=1 Tax=Eimeria praecox TaxID=51316 RepID=U6G573_9EIME|nr:SAG family member [Eimeria praecox]